MKQILVVEDDAFTRTGLAHYLNLIGYHVVETADVHSAWKYAVEQQPDKAVLDLRLPLRPEDVGTTVREPHGIDLAKQLKRSFPTMGIVIYSAYPGYKEDVIQMMQQFDRSMAFLLKGGEMDRLVQALTAVESGRNVFSHEIVNPLALQTAVRARLHPDERLWIDEALSRFPTLTDREQEIAHLVAAGYATETIADRLHVVPGTISNTMTRIYQKLSLSEARQEEQALRPLPLLVKVCMLYDIRDAG